MLYYTHSPPTKRCKTPCPDNIHLRTQFFLHKDAVRRAEIQETLRRNVVNPLISSITLLNERVYTLEELGVTSAKVVQKVIGRRARFSDLFAEREPGFTVVTNADIFFDASLERLRAADLHERRAAFALLRYEFRGETDLNACRIFGPRPDSMDTWIVHSSQELPPSVLQFELGMPGCDNKFAYLLDLLGFTVYNDPMNIKTYHLHVSPDRDYRLAQKVPPPYQLLYPARIPLPQQAMSPDDMATYSLQAGNDRLFEYIAAQGDAPFVVPRIAGFENNAAVAVTLGSTNINEKLLGIMKNNTGLQFNTLEELRGFSEAYLAAFDRCGLYASWEPWAVYTNHIRDSQTYMRRRFQKPQFNAYVFDVFHFVAGGRPWTHALANKRILIVSQFVDQIEKQPRAYPIDLFPGCTFVYVKPPMTQAKEENRGFFAEFRTLCDQVKDVEFDVALCACGGYGNPLCGFIRSLGKSAIYVGGVLQVYFGIYGQRWLDERADALRLYMTRDWVRPNVRPLGYKDVEKGCYW